MYACEGEAPVPVVPSPKSQRKSVMKPSGSNELEALKGMAWLTFAAACCPAFATGGRFADLLLAERVKLSKTAVPGADSAW